MGKSQNQDPLYIVMSSSLSDGNLKEPSIIVSVAYIAPKYFAKCFFGTEVAFVHFGRPQEIGYTEIGELV